MKKIFIIFVILLSFAFPVNAAQLLPEVLVKNTTTISAQRTGEKGKTYFYCSSGAKCSTEQVVREYYKNSGYKVMRAEYSFWEALFVLTFLDEFYPHTLHKNSKLYYDISDMAINYDDEEKIEAKCNLIKKTDLHKFINSQLQKHEQGAYIRWLDEWEIDGFKNPVEYFKSEIVQEFLTKIDNETFYKVIKHILQTNGRYPKGVPDYIVWNEKTMIFVEVKRKNEKLSPQQIEWGEYLIKTKIPYKIVRVVGYVYNPAY